MVPDVPVPDTPSRAEVKLYLRLRQKLGDDFVVYHSVRYSLGSGRGEPEQGEADFVVLHPEHGLLVIEVKGGLVTWDAHKDHWFSEGRDGRHEIRNPFEQAQRCVRAIQRLVEATRLGQEILVTWAVALPDCRIDQARLRESPYAPRLIDVYDLDDPTPRLLQIYQRFGAAAAKLTSRTQRTIEQHVLARHYRLAPTLSTRIEWERQSLALLTEPQNLCLDFLTLNHRCLVQGPAGTGKTVVAIEHARRLAAAGQRVGLVCYNRLLARFLQASVQADVCGDAIVAGTFHELCERFARAASLEWNVPQADELRQRFWKEEAPLLLVEALDHLPDSRLDHLVVDEGQDFDPDWWEALCGTLRDSRGGGLVIFCDPRQNIYQRKQSYPLTTPVFPLRLNCRNTRAIAEYCCDLVGEVERVSTLAGHGERPVLRHYANDDEQRQRIERDLHRLLDEEGLQPHQIVILGTRQLPRSSLANVATLADRPLVVMKEGAAEPDQIRYATLHSFKGLDADVVLLCDVDGNEHTCTPAHLYVAASRARHRLLVYAKRGVTLPGSTT